MQYFDNTNIDFISKRMLFFFVSALMVVVGISGLFFVGPEYGIDFVGGTEVAVKFDKSINTENIRSAVENAKLKGSEIKSYGKENQYLIRVKGESEVQTKVISALKEIKGESFTVIKVDKIGPKVGSELRISALIAIILSVIAMLIYLTFRFEFIFSLGAIVALVHDVIFSFCFIVIFNKAGIIDLELNQSILAAMLTVVGYSVNDTVIIFDRIRENRDKMKGRSFVNMINTSINETLSRTVNTVATVLIVLLILVFFGGPVLQGFAFTMFLGIITGTYSSVFVASSFVIWYIEKFRKVDVHHGSVDKKGIFGAVKA